MRAGNEGGEPRAIGGVVLAAGASTRMGSNKLLLRLGGVTLLRRAVDAALVAGLDPVVVVLGREAEVAREEISDLPCRPVENPDFASGIHTSLRAGIGALPPATSAAVVLLADMPFVTAPMIWAVAQRHLRGGHSLVLSDYAGVQAPPTLYARSLFPELLEADSGCGKKIAARHEAEAARVEWPADALADLDRPEDYERVRAELEAKKAECAPTS
jgi:molybdenum cofactor cytidylyltransferase